MTIIRSLIWLVILAALAAAGVWLANNPGHLMIDWLGRRIEMPLVAAGIGILVAFAALLLAGRILKGLLTGPSRLKKNVAQGREQRGYDELANAVLALEEAEYETALRHLKKAEARLKQPLFTDLIADMIARNADDEETREAVLNRMAEHPATAFAAMKGRIERMIKTNRRAEARTLLEKMVNERPRHGWALDKLCKLQAAQGDYEAARDSLRQQLKNKNISRDVHDWRLVEILAEQAASLAVRDGERAIGCAREAVKLKPEFTRAALTYATLLAAGGKKKQAARVLERAWEAQPHPHIVSQYLSLTRDESAEQRSHSLAQLTASQPDHPESHLAHAAEALRQGEFAIARQRLESLGSKNLSKTACRLYAALEREQFKNERAALMWEQQALAAPERIWHCSQCGFTMANWRADCSNCGAIGRFVWQLGGRPRGRPLFANADGAAIDDARRDLADHLYERLAEGEAKDATGKN